MIRMDENTTLRELQLGLRALGVEAVSLCAKRGLVVVGVRTPAATMEAEVWSVDLVSAFRGLQAKLAVLELRKKESA
jgi:hypothetical protein